MPTRPNHHSSTRLRFVGALPHNEGLLILARIEAAHGPAGWIGVGRVLKLHMTDEAVAQGSFAEAVARSTDRVNARLVQQYVEEVEVPLPIDFA